jgi:alanyl-tRNA synthetase
VTSAELRKSFLDYFSGLDHQVVASSSLVPPDDPTILFANAGMNQFKRVFQGLDNPPAPRAASVQKCIRAGGKHNDLENVGVTARHHTFFEMLGNFSFGDYFKEDAVAWAWDWVSVSLGLPADRLYATVYTDDDEAAEIWARVAPELKDGRILRFGKKHNYWAMGGTGPNGPCSELHFDRGLEYSCGKADCQPNCDCDRFMEIWNLVFMQYNTDDSGKTEPLPKPSIDTGAGLERLAAILQNGQTNYDTDLFSPIIAALAKMSGHEYQAGPAGTSHRVVADHLRALSFAIADGVALSNEGRGYVLRRILRRAARHGRQLGLHEPFLSELLPVLIRLMDDAYPELKQRTSHIANVLTAEEEQFGRTLDVGIELFEEYASRAEKDGSKVIPGDAVFKLYDTYGFPDDLTAVMARERGLSTDLEAFAAEMAGQRKRSRAGADFKQGTGQFAALTKKYADRTSEFLYDTYETSSPIIDFAPEEGAVILERTPFYSESGGQVSDTGMISADDFVFEVKDVVRDGALILHVGEPLQGRVSKADTATATVAKERRRSIERNHTATHLLHAALRQVLGDHVHQAGSLVAPDRLRFDFSHHSALTREDTGQIEAIVNARILDNINLDIDWSDFDSARARGAMALFGEKYGDRVRVVNVPGFSLELCGGTHVRATGEIGLFKMISETAVAAGVRRIEATTGMGARAYAAGREEILNVVGKLLKGDADSLPTRVEKLLERQKELEQKVRQFEAQAAKQTVSGGDSGDAEQVDGHRFTFQFGPEWQRQRVTAVADELKNSREDRSGVFGYLDPERGKVSLFVAASTGAMESGIHAGQAVQFITAKFDGRGGGKPNLGQGGFEAGDMSATDIESRVKQAAMAYFQQV